MIEKSKTFYQKYTNYFDSHSVKSIKKRTELFFSRIQKSTLKILTKPNQSWRTVVEQTQRLVPNYFIWQLWLLFHIRPSARHGLKFISDRHMRSKRRCSCVLQFTRLHAVSCVLHRPTSRVIHHSRLIFYLSFYIFVWNFLQFIELCSPPFFI